MTNTMRDQVLSVPQLIRDHIARFEQAVEGLLSDEECRSIGRIFATGCGDSHNAALASELAFEGIAGLPAEPLTSMQCGRYAIRFANDGLNGVQHAVPFVPAEPQSLVLGISVSGEVARTIEAVSLARKAGALTVGVTGNPESRIAKAANRTLDLSIPPFAHSPGVRSYGATLLGLYLLAIRLGQVRGACSQAQAHALRGELLACADAIQQTIEAVDAPVRALAERTLDQDNFVFVGHGPNYGTALFAAAKVMEASGDHAVGQDTEEWSHLQYFIRKKGTPTFVIAPPGPGYSRAAELIPVMKRVGRLVVAVVEESDDEIAGQADVVLPVSGTVREAFSPLVYPTAPELFAAHLAAVRGEPYFRGFAGPWEPGSGGNTIRSSEIMQ